VKVGVRVVTPDGRRGRLSSMWPERRFHAPPVWRAIVEFRDHTRTVYLLRDLREVTSVRGG